MRATWILFLLTWLAAPVDTPITPDRVVALFNGKDLSNWQPDVPARDIDPNVKPSFVVRNGMLVSLGKPEGHLLTKQTYRDYRLEAEYRFPASLATAASSSTRRACAPCTRCFRSRSKCR